jgi:hypothetical protein
MREYTIEGQDLDDLFTELAEGGFTSEPTYKLTIRVYGTGADKVAFSVNDAGWTMPMGQLTREVH